MKLKKVHCLFEQSGTFKNEFKKLGIEALDYDVLDEFGETDYNIDLFNEINNAYDGKESIFDSITPGGEELIMSFFPCVRFENQIYMHFQGKAFQLKNKSDEEKLEYNLKLHKELHELYNLVTKFVIVCIRKKLPMILENPYSTEHYLTRYWSLQPKLIDKDRYENGDYFNKPTQYWFVNCEPNNNLLFEPISYIERNPIHTTKSIKGKGTKTSRSMISEQYARRFIKEFILDGID